MTDDPCDPMEVVKLDGDWFAIVRRTEHGVSPTLGLNRDGTFTIGWQYNVVETSFIPYGVFTATEAIRL